MWICKKIFIFIVILIVPMTAHASNGVVAYYKSGCDYFIVETTKGYAILEWYGGYDPNEGDVITGDFEIYGIKKIYNITADQETNVWVEDFWLSKDRAIEKYIDKCE